MRGGPQRGGRPPAQAWTGGDLASRPPGPCPDLNVPHQPSLPKALGSLGVWRPEAQRAGARKQEKTWGEGSLAAGAGLWPDGGHTGLPLGLLLTSDILCLNMAAPPWAPALGQGQPPASLVHGGMTLESKTQATGAAAESSLTITPGVMQGQDADEATGRQMAKQRGPTHVYPTFPSGPLSPSRHMSQEWGGEQGTEPGVHRLPDTPWPETRPHSPAGLGAGWCLSRG